MTTKYYNFNHGAAKHGSLVLLNINVFSFYSNNGFFWFRIFGYGLKIKNLNKHSLLFSERIGKKKVIIVGKYCFSLLKK